jgi:ankyrin repeat protein
LHYSIEDQISTYKSEHTAGEMTIQDKKRTTKEPPTLVNCGDLNGRSALHHPVGQGDRDVVELLIVKGVDINAAAKDGTTPLQITKDQGNRRIVGLLSKHGAKE